MGNYQLEFEKVIKENLSGYSRPKLLLHSCCAPCSSYALECLLVYFEITVFYYNPNIYPESETNLRAKEQEKLIENINQILARKEEGGEEIALNFVPFGKVISLHSNKQKNTDKNTPYKRSEKVKVLRGSYNNEKFYQLAKGLEKEKERGLRCLNCYKLRLEKTAIIAKDQGFDYFATTLTVSPLKDAKMINELGYQLQNDNQVKWLPSDFKKKNGYMRSVELSKQFGLYRQNYCGCEFSLENK